MYALHVEGTLPQARKQKTVWIVITRYVHSHANRPKDKGIFVASSHGLFLTCRREKYTVLIQNYIMYTMIKYEVLQL